MDEISLIPTRTANRLPVYRTLRLHWKTPEPLLQLVEPRLPIRQRSPPSRLLAVPIQGDDLICLMKRDTLGANFLVAQGSTVGEESKELVPVCSAHHALNIRLSDSVRACRTNHPTITPQRSNQSARKTGTPGSGIVGRLPHDKRRQGIGCVRRDALERQHRQNNRNAMWQWRAHGRTSRLR